MTWLQWLDKYDGRILSFAQGTIAAVAGVTGIIPEAHLKYYMGAIALLGFWKNFVANKEPQ